MSLLEMLDGIHRSDRLSYVIYGDQRYWFDLEKDKLQLIFPVRYEDEVRGVLFRNCPRFQLKFPTFFNKALRLRQDPRDQELYPSGRDFDLIKTYASSQGDPLSSYASLIHAFFLGEQKEFEDIADLSAFVLEQDARLPLVGLGYEEENGCRGGVRFEISVSSKRSSWLHLCTSYAPSWLPEGGEERVLNKIQKLQKEIPRNSFLIGLDSELREQAADRTGWKRKSQRIYVSEDRAEVCELVAGYFRS
tara:strand:- start:421 stop:1164 length:744 start_codon:yes stop_codon:yes gene_type:complete